MGAGEGGKDGSKKPKLFRGGGGGGGEEGSGGVKGSIKIELNRDSAEGNVKYMKKTNAKY